MFNFSNISDKSFPGKSLRLILKILPGEVILPILQGKAKGNKWIKGSGVNGYWLGSYESEQQSIMEKNLGPGDVFLDVGSHVGFFTLLGSNLVGKKGRVFSFEPLPRNLDFLRKHVKLNKLDNVNVIPVAVSDEIGLSGFNEGASSETGSIKPDGKLKVRVTTLDALLEDKTIQAPDFIKVDVEGAQKKVLDGAINLLKNFHPSLLIEAKFEDRKDNFYSLLSELGYIVKPLGGKSLEDADNFFAYVL